MTASNRQLYRCGENGHLVLTTTSIRKLSNGFVRVVPRCVAFNPTDYKHLTNKLAVGAGAGCDFSGVVVEVGPHVQGIRAGDTVAGGQTGSNLANVEDGVYSEVIDVHADSLFIFPRPLVTDFADKIVSGPIQSFEQAASLGIAIGTVALASCWYNKLPLKRNSIKGWALIYGAASSLGFIAAQIYKWMGYNVIVVASRNHKHTFLAAGLQYLVDYHDTDWVEQAKQIANNEIVYAYDTISTGGTIEQVYQAVSHGKINTSLPIHPKKMPRPTKDIEIDTPLWYLLWNKSWPMGPWFKGNVAADELLAMRPEIFAQVNEMLAEGWLRALPISVFGTGFDHIPAAMTRFGEGVTGTKLVVRYKQANHHAPNSVL